MITSGRFFRKAVCACGVAAFSTLNIFGQTSARFHVVQERSVFYQKLPCGPKPQEVQTCARVGTVRACVAIRPTGGFGMLRIGFRVDTDTPTGWSVRVRDAVLGATLEQITIGPKPLRVWTDDVPPHGAYVELVHPSDQAHGTIQIERIDCAVSRGYDQAIVGVNGLVNLVELGPAYQWLKDLGRSVARLRFSTPTGEATCTGFLVSPAVLMTNQHCINTEEEAASLIAEFGYDTPGAGVDRVRGESIVDISVPRDYSLVRLAGNPGAKWGVLTFADNSPMPGLPLVIVEHPLGGYKQVSLEHCGVVEVNRLGAGNMPTDFAHGCDTLSGSSGSPVIDLGSQKVIGLHHFGFVFEDQPAINQAVTGRELPR
jgi:hypothetical protein